MENWQWTALILCGFGLFKEFRPSEPFFTEYIVGYKGIPQDTLIHVAYPVSTYSYLGTLAIVFLVTDFVRYRSVVILEGLAYVVTWTVLIWGPGLGWLFVVEVCYGIACSTEVAYYTYIYAKVDKEHYKKVTSYTYSAIFTGRFLGGIVAQLLVSFDLMNFHQLNFVSLASVTTGFILTFFLPSVQQSIYFYRNNFDANPKIPITSSLDQVSFSSGLIESIPTLSFTQRIKKAYPILWADCKAAYSNPYVLKWSIWWAVAMAGHLQIINYIQALWEVIASYTETDIYNGAVEAIQCALSAILAFGVGYIKLPWFKWGESFMCVISLLQAGTLILMSQTADLNIAYVCYIVFRVCFQLTITIASAEVAQGISQDSYGLIFGINTFIALSIQTILTVVVSDSAGLALPERAQFFVYGSYYGVLGILFIFVSAYTFCKHRCGLGNERNTQVSSPDGTTN